MNFNLADATIQNVNVRREKAGDDEGPIAIDLSLSGTAKPDELTGLFATKASHKRLLAQLFDADGELVTTDLARIALAREGVGCSVALTTPSGEKVEIDTADVNKIVLQPQAGMVVDWKLLVQFKPNDDQRAAVTAMIGRTVDVDVARRQGELELSREKDRRPATDPSAEMSVH